jgi:hypothetical protein
MRRVLRRSRHRPLVTIGLTLALAGVFFAVQARRHRMYAAEVGLIITEGVLTGEGQPRPRGEFRALINNAIFVTARLERLVDKHGLVKKLGVPSRALAVAAVRKLTEVTVWQDYFEYARRSTDPPRSARVTIGFSAPDPATALAVARDLGEIVAETQTDQEADAAAARVAALRAIAENAAARAARQSEYAWRERENALRSPGGLPPREPAHVSSEAQQAARAAAARLFDAQLRSSSIGTSGHRVQVVDPGIPIWQTMSLRARLVRQGGLALLFGVVLAVILVGAADPTVRDEQDLRRVGLRPLGSIPVCGDRPSGARPSRTEV